MLLPMQRAFISFIVFVGLILIFDMMWNGSMLTREIYHGLETAARHVDDAASNMVAFLRSG